MLCKVTCKESIMRSLITQGNVYKLIFSSCGAEEGSISNFIYRAFIYIRFSYIVLHFVSQMVDLNEEE